MKISRDLIVIPPNGFWRFLVLLVVVFGVYSASPVVSEAATYYIDAEDGNDSNSGLSEGDAWKTITKPTVLAGMGTFLPGDNILFKRGQTHTNNTGLYLDDSGTALDPIVVGAYGSGAVPILNTNQQTIYITTSRSYITIQDLELQSNNSIYGVEISNGTHTNITLQNIKTNDVVIINSAATTNGLSILESELDSIEHGGISNNDTFEGITLASSYYYGILFNGSQPPNNLSLNNISINVSGTGILFNNGLNNSTLTNITTTGTNQANSAGIEIHNGSNVTITGATTTNYTNGVLLSGTVKHNIDIEGLYSADNGTGLKVNTNSTSSITVSDSVLENNNASGVLVDSTGNTIYLNNITTKNNGSNGIIIQQANTTTLNNSNIDGVSNLGNMTMLNNIINTPNSRIPVYFMGTATGTIAHNTINSDSNTYGVNVSLGAHATIYNNLVTSYSTTGIFFSDLFGQGGVTESHNLIYSDTGSPTAGFTPSPSTIIGVDPKLNSDFSLQSGSPAIDAGMVIAGHTADFLGNPILGLPDIGAFEWQGEEESGGSGGGSFVIKQSIYNEISLSIGSSLTLSPSIPGVTGGVSSGELPFNIKTNNPLGYQVDLSFAQAVPFRHLFSPSAYIFNYAPVIAGVPDYEAIVPNKSHSFAYSVFSPDVTQLFRHSGSTCGTGSSNTLGKCWFNRVDASLATTIIERNSATGAEGATSTLQFKVLVDQNPTPMLPNGEYQATVTVTVLPL